jgi:Putative zinc-finger
MEHAPLRPVPTRPAGAVEPAAAARALALTLPELGERELPALAQVALAGIPRAQAAPSIGITEEELARSLAAGRKALRRTVSPLSASGWCERAERLISDRLDGELGERDVARLDVHLRNCPRCVEHERRLVRATDLLLSSLVEPVPVPHPATPPAELSVVGEEAVASPPEATAGPPAQPAALPIEAPAPAAAAPARSARQLAGSLAWGVLIVLAVILAVAALALAVAGVLGADL